MDTTTTQSKRPKKGGFAQWAIVAAIVIVLNLFFNYAISLAYKAPLYGDYFPTSQIVQPITDEGDCIVSGGQWTEAAPQAVPDLGSASGVAPTGYCDPNYTNQMHYDAAMKSYDLNVFLILMALGVVSLVLGAMLANMVLSLAFSWGGVLSLLVASMRYWSDAGNILKVFLLAAALAALIFVAVRKFGK